MTSDHTPIGDRAATSGRHLGAHPAGRPSVSFTFEGRQLTAAKGQSVAAALLAADVRVLTRSFKFRRPRGYTCGFDACGNCPLTVDGLTGVSACTAIVRGGENVRRERGWPSTDRDLFRLSDVFARFIPAGFQFRLFRSHPRLAHRAESVMAHIAGAGRLPTPGAAAARRTTVTTDHSDLLVVGGGLSGCAAALAAADAGASVVLVHRDLLGGRSCARIHPVEYDGTTRRACDAAAELAARVTAHSRIRVLHGTAVAWFEGNVVPVVTDGELIECRPRHVIAATGSYDVPALHAGNDKPGVMLADGVSRLLEVDRVAPGRRAVVLTDSARGYWLARQLIDSGVAVTALVDRRTDPGDDPALLAPGADVEILTGADVERAMGRTRLRTVQIRTAQGTRRIKADLLCIALRERPATDLALQWHYVHAGSTDAVAGGWSEVGDTAPEAGLTTVGSAAGWVTEDLGRAAEAGARAVEYMIAQSARSTADPLTAGCGSAFADEPSNPATVTGSAGSQDEQENT